MRKLWIGICIAAGVLTACSNDNDQQQNASVSVPAPVVCTGPIVEISGAEPRYENLNPSVNQDYQRDGKSYKIVQDPASFSQAGLAAIYDAEPGSNLTASGETFDPMQLTAAHPTLPIPSYARITNLANGRMLVVRINDRGPYGNDRVISLSRASADRLNTSNNTKVRIDPITVAPDGTLSGPGTACTTVAKQTYALPARPDLGGGMGSASAPPQAPSDSGSVLAISNDTLTPVHDASVADNPAPVDSGAPVAEASAPADAEAATPRGTQDAPITAPGSVQGSAAPATQAPVSTTPPSQAAAGGYVVQVGAVSDQTRAQQYQQKLSKEFAAPGRIMANGAMWRIQLGPFSNKAEASILQQRLQNEAQLQSFITHAN